MHKCSLKNDGKVLMQFGGRGNAAAILEVVDGLISEVKWSGYFEGFRFPYGFFGPDEYRTWLERAGLSALRMDFICEVVDRYIRVHPLDDEGNVHVGMVRLEVEAEKNDHGNTSQTTGL